MTDRDQTASAAPRIVIAAGGTGGHVYPAASLAQALIGRGYRVAFLTDARGRQFPGIDDADPRIEQFVLPVARLSRTPKGLIAGSAGLALAYVKALGLIGRLRPAMVVGFGGYPSFPPLLAATHRRVPTLIHEQNAVIGRTNRALARRVDAIALSFARTQRLGARAVSKSHLIGNPVRPAIAERAESPYVQPGEDEAFRLLVTGGSQGASVFSTLLPAAVAALAEPLRHRLSIVQQCRREDIEAVRQTYAALGVSAELSAFFEDMPALLTGAHLVICRAGASSVAEVTTIGRPAIFVPYPHATNDHQHANAATVAQAGGGWLADQTSLTPEELANRLEYLIAEPCALATAAQVAASMGHTHAATRLADLVETLAADRRPVGEIADADQRGGGGTQRSRVPFQPVVIGGRSS